MRQALIIVGIGALILAGGWWFLADQGTETARNTWQPPTTAPSTEGPYGPPPSANLEQGASIGSENLAELTCAEGKTIIAVFARDIVGLTLSDGRQIELRQANTENGVVYFNNTQTIELRGGAGPASLIENGKTTYADCTLIDTTLY